MEIQEVLVMLLAKGWEDAFHNADSLSMVAQHVPNWQELQQVALVDPVRVALAEPVVAGIRRAVEEVLSGRCADLQSLQALLERPLKPPN